MRTSPTLKQPSRAADGGLNLVVLGEGGGVSHHVLPPSGAVTIGRSASCDVFVDDPSISRRHAVLHIGPPLAIEDLGSANGTRVGSATLPAGQVVRIAPNQPIDLGATVIVLQARPRPAPFQLLEAGEPGVRVMEQLGRLAERIAVGDINVLVLGETGVGKEVMSERIHRHSPRAARPFLRLNCAALSEHLLESELFGHERGAFTGAMVAKPGLLETADGGTVFLDEIGELPPGMQVKLLRVLEERKLRRVGAVQPREIDVRYIAATNRDLGADVASGRFREDLYYRLNGISLSIPPLRERLCEIAGLANQFAAAARRRANAAPVAIGPDALEVLLAHPWPGNIRELKNVVERAVLLAGDEPIRPVHLSLERALRRVPELAPARVVPAEPLATIDALDETRGRLRRELDDVERKRIATALADCAGNQSRAAELLNMPRRTLVAKLKHLAIPRPRRAR
jgi:two-component system, NtrC family, response regulator AtoC